MYAFFIALTLFTRFHSTSYAAPNETKSTTSSSALVQPYQQPKMPEQPSLLLGFVRMFFSLVFVIFLAYILLKFLGKRMKKLQTGEFISIIDTLGIGPNKGIYIVEIAGRYIAVGVSENSINNLFEVDDPEMIEKLQGHKLQKGQMVDASSFGSYLSNIMTRGTSEGLSPRHKGVNPGQMFEDQLQRLRGIRQKKHKGGKDEDLD